MLSQLESFPGRLAENRHALDEYLQSLTDEEMRRSPGEGLYSGREVLAHLAGANRGMTRLMQQMAAGQQPRLKADYNNDYYNLRQQEKRAALSVAQLLAELDETHRDLLAFIETLRPEDLDKRGDHPTVGNATVLQVLQVITTHEQDHIAQFGAWARTLHSAAS